MFPDVLDVCEGSQLRSLDKNKSSDLNLTILQDNVIDVLDGGEASSLEELEMADGGSFLLRRYLRQNQTLPSRLGCLCCQEIPEGRREDEEPLVSRGDAC